MGIVQVFLDPSAPWIITGPVEFDVTEGGHLKLPQGTAFPTDPAPEEGDFFHRTDENKTYRYNGATWVLGVAAVAAHASSHQPGGSDTMAVDAAAGTGSLRTLGTGATQACSGTDARLSDARTPTAHKTSHEPGGGDALTVDAAAGTGSLRTLGTGATSACAGNDGRLSDARTPTAHATSHRHGGSDEVATATAGANVIPKAGAAGKLDIGFVPLGSTSTTVCVGNDARLSDARTPTAHKTSHEPGGGDALTVDAAAGTGSLRTLGTGATSACAGNDARLSNARTPTAHASSHQPGGGDAMAVDAVAGTGSLRTLGTGAQQACAGSDARLSDSRTPTAHSASHRHGGSDEVATATAGANVIPKTGAGGKLDIGFVPLGSTASTVCVGNDARLSDARTPTAHKTTHEPGGGDALTVDAVAGTGSLRTLGTGAQQACAGNDARLSDNRTDVNAIHKNVSAEISTITEKATPVAADLLVIEDSAASNVKKRVQIGNLPAGSAPIFGRDYASSVSEANSTTTSSTYQDKVSLVTGALTGTYLVEWQCEMTIASANRQHQCRLYDATAAAELCNDDHRPSVANAWKLASGFALVTFVGAAKTLKIQFASQNNSTTVTIRRARVVMWRVS